MRFATIELDGRAQPVIVSPDGTHFCTVSAAKPGFSGDLVDFIAAGEPLPAPSDWTALEGHAVHAPIPQPRRNVFCVGKNYHEHAKEFAQSGYDTSAAKGELSPEFPVIFTKPASAVVADKAEVHAFAELTQQLDYEAELAIIIGKPGRGISKESALEHVWGYTIFNDVTARDLQQNIGNGSSANRWTVSARWPERTKRPESTDKRTKPEHQAALRMGSGVALSGRNPSVFSDIPCAAPQT